MALMLRRSCWNSAARRSLWGAVRQAANSATASATCGACGAAAT
jgi:hypothetical protein